MEEIIKGWGLYSKIKADKFLVDSQNKIIPILEKLKKEQKHIIPRALGRSYGDSSLSANVLDLTKLNKFTNFNQETGVLSCLAGTTIDDILKYLVPKGWFVPVTPGTKYVTIGGAIASDVHGKNHHLEGCFSEFVSDIKLMTASGEIISCSKENNKEIFYATCGGMGLTGIIIEATIQLAPIKSNYIKQTIIKTNSIEEMISELEKNHLKKYSVAWIDLLNSKNNILKGLLLLGEEHHDSIDLNNIHKSGKFRIPFTTPIRFFNKYSISFYNKLHYSINSNNVENEVHYDDFFYPLDKIHNWNFLYGSKGFLQYQFVIPKNEEVIENIKYIFNFIKENNLNSYLVVLKKFGVANKNYLSFPEEGYTITFDFKVDKNVFNILDKLDQKIVDFGGKLYLTKDARMRKEIFQKSYKNIEKFLEIKSLLDPDNIFISEQYKRLFDE